MLSGKKINIKFVKIRNTLNSRSNNYIKNYCYSYVINLEK